VRVAARVAKVVQRLDATTHLLAGGGRRADAQSVLQLLTLGAARGARLQIVATGPDEDAVIRELSELFEHGGGI
jgi:PTS hybrid protein